MFKYWRWSASECRHKQFANWILFSSKRTNSFLRMILIQQIDWWCKSTISSNKIILEKSHKFPCVLYLNIFFFLRKANYLPRLETTSFGKFDFTGVSCILSELYRKTQYIHKMFRIFLSELVYLFVKCFGI